MTFDREPDLDNANVGMPDTRILGITKYIKEVTKSVASVAEYLATTNYDPKRIAVERNGDIVPKSQYGETVLQDGDSVEVVSFVGGG